MRDGSETEALLAAVAHEERVALHPANVCHTGNLVKFHCAGEGARRKERGVAASEGETLRELRVCIKAHAPWQCLPSHSSAVGRR